MLESSSQTNRQLAVLDPALLAFIKCHVTSLAKWHTLRALCDQPDRWLDASSLSRGCASSAEAVGQALADLAREGVVEEMSGPVYRLNGDDPTARVLSRLLAALGKSLELRQILVAHLRQGVETGSPFGARTTV